MAGFAGYDRGISQAVVEHAIETESRNAVAVTTIDGCQIDSCHCGMARRWVTDIVGGRCTMTSIATGPDDGGVGVIGEGPLKTGRRMTANAFCGGNRMVARGNISRCGRFTDGCVTVVASGTSTGNARMIKAAVQAEGKKTGGIVAVIALGTRR